MRLAQKAFYPAPIPFPLLHVDTGYKFREMLEFRDRYTAELGAKLIVWRNGEAIDDGANPFRLGTQRCCGLLKTQALLDGLRQGNFDAAFGGARRDEEKSRAKERIFSFRDEKGQWVRRTNGPSSGICLTPAFIPAKASAFFRFQLDRNGHLAVHSSGKNSHRAAVLREGARMLVRGDSLILLEQPFIPLLPGEKPQMVRCRCVRSVAPRAPAPSVPTPTRFRKLSKN